MVSLTKSRIIGILGVFVITASMLLAGCLDDGEETQRIKLVKSGGQGMMDGMDADTIDAMIGWEPWNANAIVGEKGFTYKNSSEIWDHHPCCALAADNDWYVSVSNADEILNRVAWVHMKTTEWINDAKPTTSSDHDEMITLATEFTGRSEAVVEYALLNIDFDHSIDSAGVKTYAQKLEEYSIFNDQKWEDSGFANTDAYVDDVLDDQYITWAVANSDKTSEDIALDSPVEIRFGYLTADLHQLSFWVAWKQGWFEDVNITVKESNSPQYPREFSNGGDEMKTGFKTGEIDVGFLGTAPAIIFGINENDFLESSPYYKETTIKIIAGVNYEGSAIVIRSGLKVDSMKDLEGKTLAYPGPGTVQHFLILMAAEQDGAKVQEV
ncbi:MAG: ABC transporter substrate-binding protein [Thermoplasmata archaeon]